MNILMLDTTKKEAVLQVYANGVNVTQTILSQQKHNETLLVNLEALLKNAKTSLSEMHAIACVTGPGSFTGIRVGMATVKALAIAKNLPILSANTFEIVSEFVNNGTVLLHSTASSSYFAEIINGKVSKVGVLEHDQWEQFLLGHDKLFCLQNEQEQFGFSYNNFETIKNYNYLLYQFFKNKAQAKNFTTQALFEPFYIQLSQAERELVKKETKK